MKAFLQLAGIAVAGIVFGGSTVYLRMRKPPEDPQRDDYTEADIIQVMHRVGGDEMVKDFLKRGRINKYDRTYFNMYRSALEELGMGHIIEELLAEAA